MASVSICSGDASAGIYSSPFDILPTNEFSIALIANLFDYPGKTTTNIASQYFSPVFWCPYNMELTLIGYIIIGVVRCFVRHKNIMQHAAI